MARSQKIRSGTVKVDGLTELNRALKAIGPDAQKELREASKKVAEFVADDARAAAHTIGGVAAHVAPSIKPVGGVAGSGVAMGGARYPMAGVAEFGAYGSTKSGWYANSNREGRPQFKPWRGNSSDAGYFLYPAIRQDADRIETEFTHAIDDIIQRRFPQ